MREECAERNIWLSVLAGFLAVTLVIWSACGRHSVSGRPFPTALSSLGLGESWDVGSQLPLREF